MTRGYQHQQGESDEPRRAQASAPSGGRSRAQGAGKSEGNRSPLEDQPIEQHRSSRFGPKPRRQQQSN